MNDFGKMSNAELANMIRDVVADEHPTIRNCVDEAARRLELNIIAADVDAPSRRQLPPVEFCEWEDALVTAALDREAKEMP
jgi:hypothetical protein